MIRYLTRGDDWLVFRANDIFYRYTFTAPGVLESVEYIAKRWPSKALNVAKRKAIKIERLVPNEAHP